MEIHRFGPGHRRAEGPPGTSGITGQVIWNDHRANVSELAFARRAAIVPHDNPNTTLFIVVSGGGFVQVGDELTRINHGEAVVWPPDVLHGAYTDGSEMRAILVELTGPEELAIAVLDAKATTVEPATGLSGTPVEPARGSLAPKPPSRDDHDETEGEPW